MQQRFTINDLNDATAKVVTDAGDNLEVPQAWLPANAEVEGVLTVRAYCSLDVCLVEFAIDRGRRAADPPATLQAGHEEGPDFGGQVGS